MEWVIIDLASQMGAVWLLVIVLVWIIYRNDLKLSQKEISHSSERSDWREHSERQHGEVVELAKHTHTVLSEIKTLLKR